MQTYKEIRQKVEDLQKQMNILDRKLGDAIAEAVTEVGKENSSKVKKLAGGDSFIVRYSDFVGHAWSPTLFNWESAAKALMQYLDKVPTTEAVTKIKALIADSDNDEVRLVRNYYYKGTPYKDVAVVSKDFLEKVLARLE